MKGKSWRFELESERGREVCLHFVQTTVDDIGRAVRSVGVSLEAGHVAFGNASRLNAYPPDLAARH